MRPTQALIHPLLWAAAILASALVGAPDFLTLILLPALATISLLTVPRPARNGRCRA